MSLKSISRNALPRLMQVMAILLLLAGAVTQSLPAAHAAPLYAAIGVNTTVDEYGTGASCSLREAIQAANTDLAFGGCPAGSGADIITLPAGTYTLTISGNNEQDNVTGDLDILSNLTIQGATGAPADVIIRGGAGWNDKIIDINPNVDRVLTVTISGVTVRDGNNNSNADYYGSGIQAFGRNYGVYASAGTLTLQNCIVTNNTYAGLTVTDSGAGGLLAEQINLNIDNCTFSNNSAGLNGYGGGISIIGYDENVSITNSTFTGNSSLNYPGGGIFIRRSSAVGYPNVAGTITLNKNTFTGNSSTNGGGIYLMVQSGAKPVSLTVGVNNSVFVGNTATTSGGGMYYSDLGSPNPATVSAENNWWGCSSGPGSAGCDTAAHASAVLDFNPWLRDQLTSSAGATLVTNQASTMTASFLTNSNNAAVPPANLTQLIGRSVTWSATNGSLSGSQATIQASGTATSTFRAAGVGASVIYAKVDNDSITAPSSNVISLTVNKANTTTIITSDSPEPSQVVTVYYSVTGAHGNSPTAPTGNVTVSDGVDSCTGTVATGFCEITLTTGGVRTLTATYAGDANFNGSTSPGEPHATRYLTTTTITSDDPDPSVVGQVVTVNYTVTSPDPGTPTGNVTVSDGTNSCIGTVAAGFCNVTFTSVGSKTLVATYAGNSSFSGSTSASVAHTVNKANTTTAITSDTPDPSVVGQAVTVNYTVSPVAPGAGTPTGNVTVSDGTNSCIGTVAAGSCNLTFTSAGSKTLTATYAGDSNFNGSTSASAAHAVDKANTTTTITSDTPDPSVVGQSVTFNFTVSPVAPGAGTPSGNVTVSDGTHSCTGTVVAGSCQITFTAPSTTNFTATYTGDTNFTGSVSALAAHTVAKSGTSTVITSNVPASSSFGESVTFSYAVSPVAPGAGTPTGNVTVSDGTDSCSATVAAGSCSITFTSAGPKTLTATYAGDTNFNGSISAGYPVTVNKAVDTPSVSNSPQAYTGTARAIAVTCASGGTATDITPASQTNVGTYPVTASCPGNVNYSATTNVFAGNFVITPTYTVTYDGNTNTGGIAPVDVNSPYDDNATVTVLGPGTLTKTGHTFSNWNTAADGSGVGYAPGDTFTLSAANVILFAQWNINTYTVTFDSQGGSAVPSQTVNHGGLAAKPTDPTRADYIFAGWYDSPIGGALWDFANHAITAPTTLYARWMTGISVSWVGGVSIESDQPIVAVGRPHLGSEVASYIGANAGSLTQYVPMLFKGAFGGGYNAALYVQNISASTTSVMLEFFDNVGTVVYTKNDSIGPNAIKGYWLPSEAGLPDGFVGGVKVTASQNILAVGRPHANGQVMSYNGFGAGSTTAWLPMFFKNGFGNYNTAIYVQNVTGFDADLTIQFLNLDGTVACTYGDAIAANASKGYWSLSVACDTGSLPSGFVGGVRVTSTQNILAVARPHLGAQITTYNGFVGGANTAYVPMLFRKAFGGSYNAALYLQNVSGNSANVAIEYVDNAGAVAATQNVTLAAGAISSIWLPTVAGLPDGFVGGARIAATQDVIAVGRPHLGSEITTYNGTSAGSLNAYLPMLFKNAYAAPYQAAFYIQNVTGNAANVDISFYNEAGALSCIKSINLAANATQGFWMPTVSCAP